MNKINTIIFDYDGTLHNSIIIYAEAFRQAYKHLVKKGYVKEKLWTDQEISKWIGLNPRDMWNEFMPQLPEAEKRICSNMIGSYMIQYINEGKAKLYESSIDVLEYLNEKGYKLILVSNCKTQYMESHRKVFNLDNYFKDIYSSEEFKFIAKYEIFYKIKEKYGGDFLIIGDRYQDMEIAKIHDLIFIACKYGFGKEEELKGSNFSIDNISEIKNILDKIN